MQYTGPPRGGATSGSCFPPSFGGSCSGTPPECQDCSKALECQEDDGEENIVGTLGGSGKPSGIIGSVGAVEGTGLVSPVQKPKPEG